MLNSGIVEDCVDTIREKGISMIPEVLREQTERKGKC